MVLFYCIQRTSQATLIATCLNKLKGDITFKELQFWTSFIDLQVWFKQKSHK